MNRTSKTIVTALASTAVLGALALSPVFELQAKASVDSQSKAKTKAAATLATRSNAKAKALATTEDTTAKAVEAQLAARGVNFTKLTTAQQKDTYVDVIIQLAAAPAAENGSLSTNASTAEIQAATEKVIAAQASTKAAVAAITAQGTGESYGYVINGFTTKVQVKDLTKLEQVAGVKSVSIAKVYYAAESSANDMANVSTVWSNYKYKGEGTVVSVIDTGIDPNHKDFRLSDASTAKLSEKDVNGFISKTGYGRYYTSKVPYGHNYADNDEIITDDNPEEQHGMHVAGIIGANGTGSDPTTSVVGVAPEAQLLAMKVFSNSDTAATTDSTSVVGAIDDSAKLGADVLNMSLGSASGKQSDDDPEVAAVENAINAGTAAVISAGNDGTSVSDQDGTNVDYFGNPDMEMVGTPGTARHATTVASAENTKAINNAITISADGTTILGPSMTETGTGFDLTAFDGKQFYEVKDADGNLGIGTADQFTADVKGKIAIVKRGDINFTEKQANAKAAGAAGVLIVNNAGGDEALTSVAYDAGFPTAGLSTNDGDKLVAYLAANPDATFNVEIGLKQMDNTLTATDAMSTFSSYGPTSDLSFKPDITAPGGNIWSTQNNNGYTNLSGTSMASPFIAGSQALLTQAMNDKNGKYYALYQSMTASERAAFMKTIEMNTATEITDVDRDAVIESPRRQGAGMVDVDAAIDAISKNPSTVTGANDYPGVELKDFDEATHQFTLKFTNRTDQPITYTLKDNAKLTAVYTSATDAQTATLYDKAIAGANIKADSTIAVPAGTTQEFTFTLTLPSDFEKDQYVEGFLNFEGSDDSKLSIPYMGFYGSWGDPQLFDDFNGVTFTPTTTGNTGTIVNGGNDEDGAISNPGLTTDAQGNYVIDTNNIAFSTAPGADIAWIQPEYWMFRNANDVQTQLLDDQGNLLTTFSTYKAATKSYWYANGQTYEKLDGAEFDGTYFDPQTNQTETLPDGTYTYRVVGTPDGTDKQQVLDFKVKIDSVKPEVRNLKLTAETDQDGNKQYYLTAEAFDNFSGLDGSANTAVNGVENDGDQDPTSYETEGTTADGYTKIKIALSDAQVKALAAGRNSIAIGVFDNASNAATTSATAQKPGETNWGLVFDQGSLPDKITTQTKGLNDDGTAFEFGGNYLVEPSFTYTDADGNEHDGTVDFADDNSGNFTADLPVSDDDYTTTVKVYTDDSKQTLLYEKQIQVAMKTPEIDALAVDGQATYKQGDQAATTAQSSETQVTLTGTVSDDTQTVQVVVGDQTIDATVNADHTFTADVPIAGGDNTAKVTATDADGNQTEVDQPITSSNYGVVAPSNKDVSFDDGIAFGYNYIAADTKNYDPATGKITITGKVARPTTNLTIGDQKVKINSDGTFSVTLDIGTHHGNNFGVLIGDDTSTTTIQERISLYVDANLPTLTVDQAKDTDGDGVNDTITTSDPNFTLTGNVKDDNTYADLYINDSNVMAGYGDVDFNADKGYDQDFSQTETLKPGKNTFNIYAQDYIGNKTAVQTIVVNYVPATAEDTAALKDAKAALKATLTKARELGATGDYTHETAAVLASARQQAQKVLNDKDATLADVQAAQTALDNAIAQLVKKDATTTPTVDPNADILAAIQEAKQSLGTTTGETQDPATGRTYYGDLDNLTAEVKAGTVTPEEAKKQLNAFLNQATTLDEIAAAKQQVAAAGLGETKAPSGRTFNGDFDYLYNQAKAGTLTPAQATAQLNALLDDALDTLANEIKQATPEATGNSTDAATGRSWYGDVDNAKNTGKAATTPDQKLAQLTELANFKPLIAAQVKADAAAAYAQALAAKNAAAAAKNTAANNTRFGGSDVEGAAAKANAAAAAQAAREAAQAKLLAQQAKAKAAADAQAKAAAAAQPTALATTGAAKATKLSVATDTKQQAALPATGDQAQTGLMALGAAMIAGVLAFFGKKKADER